MPPKKICPCSKCKRECRWPNSTVKRHLQEDEMRANLQTLRAQRSKSYTARPEVNGKASSAALPSPPPPDPDLGPFGSSEAPITEQIPDNHQLEGSSNNDYSLLSTFSDQENAAADELTSTDGSLQMSDQELLQALLQDRDRSPLSTDSAHRDSQLAGSLMDEEDMVDLRTQAERASQGPDSPGPLDLEDDPLYRSREDLFGHPSPDEAGSPPHESPSGLPPAFDEDPLLRNIYIRTLVQATFKGASQDAIHDMLQSELLTLTALQERGLLLDLDLTRFPKTLATLERRLSITPDEHITYYFICPECWTRTHPLQLYKLDSPYCSKNGCDGILYTTNGVKDTSGRFKRTPRKLLPYSSLILAIRRMLLRPGKAEEVEHWRTHEDQGVKEPISREAWLDMIDDDTKLHDIHDGAAWRSIEANVRRVMDNERCVVRNTTRPDSSQRIRFVSRRLSLLFTINVDWMQPVESRVHSTGAVYITVNNLPRHLRMLRQNTFLLCVIPGPTEPSLEQMNVITELVVEEIAQLATGVEMPVLRHVSDDESPEAVGSISEEIVYGDMLNNCSDTPARAKTSGLVATTSDEHMCPICWATLPSLTSPKCFDPSHFKFRDPDSMMFWKLYAETCDRQDQEMIAQARGVRFSSFDKLPTWRGAWSSPGEPMHMILLGCTATMHKVILLGGGMFVGSRKKNAPQPTARYEEFMDSIWWPSFVSRVPPKLGKGNGKIKADQWRYLLTVYPVALFLAWRDEHDDIPDKEAPLPPKSQTTTSKATQRSNTIVQNRKKKNLANVVTQADDIDSSDLEDAFEDATSSKADRNYKKHFSAVLNFITAVRIILTWTITLNEAARAERFFGLAFRAWASMGCHLTPNFHAALHIRLWIELFGPVYAWWVYAFERMNGILARFRTNGRGGGELEATLLRSWIKLTMLQDLAAHMQNIPNPSDDDKATTSILLASMKGGGEGEVARGTFLTYLAAITPTNFPDGVALPKKSKILDLHAVGLYIAVLRFAQISINPNICSYGDMPAVNRRQIRLGSKFKSYSSIHVLGRKYGAYQTPRGKTLGYAYLRGRKAVRIDYLFTLTTCDDEKEDSLHCAVIRRWAPAAESLKTPPWNPYARDLGIAMWKDEDEELIPPEIVPVTDLDGHFAWAPLLYQAERFKVTFSLDHRSHEPDFGDE